jgi:tellurite resistance-related uncharacterized protein
MSDLVQPTQFEVKNSPVGSLGIIEFSSLDISPARIYWISNVPEGSERGHHAHKALSQVICILTGSVDVEILDGMQETVIHLNASSGALTLMPGLWRVLRNFSADACVLVICDQPYDESDYIRNFADYLEWHSTRND